MNNITMKKPLFVICLALFLVLMEPACNPGSDTKKIRKKLPSHSITKSKKKPAVKKVQKIKKPVFQPQAGITLADGKVYEVGEFTFYSKHSSFGGGFYTPSSGNKKWPFYLHLGPIWEKIDFIKVKSIGFKKKKRDYKRLSINILLMDGSRQKGSHPLYAYKYLWAKHGRVHLAGKSKILGRIGNFQCKLESVSSFERVEAGPGTPPAFKVVYNEKEKSEAVITDPHIRLIWKKSTPTYLTAYKLRTSMSIIVNNTEIKIKPEEIESVTVPQNSSSKFTIKMKLGETVMTRKFPPRVFGKLKNGNVIFTEFFNNRKAVVKEVRIN